MADFDQAQGLQVLEVAFRILRRVESALHTSTLAVGLVQPTHVPGVCLGAILDWTMGTPAGFAAFRDPKVNAALKKILTAWCDYLDSPDSLYVLNDSPSGWTSDAAAPTGGAEPASWPWPIRWPTTRSA